MDKEKEEKPYPLLGSIANAVGMGYLGNDAMIAIANQMGVRVVSVPSSVGERARRHGRPAPNGDRPGAVSPRGDVPLEPRPVVMVIGYSRRPRT